MGGPKKLSLRPNLFSLLGEIWVRQGPVSKREGPPSIGPQRVSAPEMVKFRVTRLYCLPDRGGQRLTADQKGYSWQKPESM